MTNIFNIENTEVTATVDDSVDYVDVLVGEGKKFKDVQGLAKGKAEADRTIEILKQKLDEAKQELNTRTSLSDILTEIKKGNKQEPVVVDQPVVQTSGTLDDSTLESKLEEILAAREMKKAQETNLEKVTRVLTTQFGDQTQLVLQKKSQELGMSVKALEGLATSSPQAFFQLVGIQENPQVQSSAVPQNRINSLATPSTNGLRNKAYYEKMRQADPKKYFANETTVSMIKDMAALGDKWYS